MGKQYCKASQGNIIDQFNNPLFLKGVGIGGWLLLEGYMIQSYQSLDRPRRIKEYISSYIGKAYAEYFFETWFQHFFQEQDIKLIKEAGFNCIRIPLDYQFLFNPSEKEESLVMIESHFALLDEIIKVCKQEKIYVILDLHAAPGGQTGTNIDNSLDDLPRLFLNPLYQKQTIFIWKELASRYKEEDYIVAYDLLNEPLPNWFSEYNQELLPLYQKIIDEIRTVDPHHMITLEGVHWSTDLSILTGFRDDNILLQFHKYWSNPDKESIKDYLQLRDKLTLPLLMGEGGENNLLWYSAVFKMYEEQNISYVFWTYKKMAANNSIINVKKPKKWDDFLQHRLSKEEAKTVLDELLNNIQFEASMINHQVGNHIIKRNDFTLPAYAFDDQNNNLVKQHIFKEDTSLRKTSGYFIGNKKGEIIKPNFKQYNGEDIPVEDMLYLFLHEGESVNYTFVLSKNCDVTIHIRCNHPNNLITFVNNQKYEHKDGTLLLEKSKDRVALLIKATSLTRIESIELRQFKKT